MCFSGNLVETLVIFIMFAMKNKATITENKHIRLLHNAKHLMYPHYV